MRYLVLVVVVVWMCLQSSCAHSNDGTLMGVCPTSNQFYYPDGDDVRSFACVSPEALPVWRVPVSVTIDDSVDDREAVRYAVNFWNQQMGYKLFVISDGLGDVIVRVGTESRCDRAAACAYHEYDGDGTLRGYADVVRVHSSTEAYYAIAHELGHLLGLAHDPGDNMSIMYRSVLRNITVNRPFPPVYVTPNDKAAVRARYPQP